VSDLIFVGIVVGFVALSLGLIAGCRWLMEERT